MILVSRAESTKKSGGFVNAGGWGTRKLADQFHAASTRRDKNTRPAWKRGRTDVLTLLTGPLSSCKLPLTNRDPNDLTEAFPFPKKLTAALCFCMFFKQIWSSTNQQIPQFSGHVDAIKH